MNKRSYFGIVSMLLVGLFVLSACERPEEPEFKEVKNLKVHKVTLTSLSLRGDAIFHNPNNTGLTLTSTEIDIMLDDSVKVAAINQTLDTKIKANETFSVPLEVNIPIDKVSNNMLNDAIGMLFGKKTLDVRYKGFFRMKVLGVGFKVPVDYTDEVKF